MKKIFDEIEHSFDVCVVGGGMAGLCAAIASARGGAKTVLVQDRPVLGGNASSEIRMWICGAHGVKNKETGILEEILLRNCYRNPGANYSLWDSVLYEKAAFCPNLTLMLNSTCCGGEGDGKTLNQIRVWQLTSQTWHLISARLFIDCSGDSVLAPISGAPTRHGRESCSEFDEDIQPEVADRKTMGNSLLIQIQKVENARPFITPPWAYVFDDPEHFKKRIRASSMGHNYWWIEIGGLQDTIADAESIRHELMRTVYGICDYLKNSGPAELRKQYEEWDFTWIGALPGKRENRRYIGPHVLTQNDIQGGGVFDDVVAYGGWSMDDHHPAGLFYPGAPTIFHPAPSPYGIPFRSLYSSTVQNLLCAGRNISVTHAALSSTRVMGTTSLLGQAAGTAAALAIEKNCLPDALYPAHVAELQQRLMDADLWLPGRARPITELTGEATWAADDQVLLDGHERPTDDGDHIWERTPGTPVEIAWSSPRRIGSVRVVFDSNLGDRKRMPYKQEPGPDPCAMPKEMVRAFRVERRLADGKWETIQAVKENHARLVQLSLNTETDALRLVPESTWGAESARMYSVDVASDARFAGLPGPERETWSAQIAALPPDALAAPAKDIEKNAYVGA